MGLMSCFLAHKKKPKPSSNISKWCLKGYGHYKESHFELVIYKKCVDQDWWIESEAYKKLITDLGKVTLSPWQRRGYACDLIARVPKDLPANPGVRFPRGSGTHGEDDYEPVRFVRVGAEMRKYFQCLMARSKGESYYLEILGKILVTSVPSYTRDSFESTFAIGWNDSKGVNNIKY